jgi:hypothetical protein
MTITPADRAAINATIQEQLEQNGIKTAYLARFDFASETIFISTLQWAIKPTGTGDALLDGNQFEPFIQGTPYDIGSNQYSEQGSGAFEMTLQLPADLPTELQAASIQPEEYLARPATIWRAILTQPPGIAGPGVWSFVRIRTGRMDQLEFTEDGTQSVVKLTIEAWASYISDANQSSYSDQRRFDPNDTSQNFLESTQDGQPIANSPSYRPSGWNAITNSILGKGAKLV